MTDQEFYHHGVKGQKWGVTHDRPKARRKYVTNNGEGVHRRGRHKLTKEQRRAKEVGASLEALRRSKVTVHKDAGYQRYNKEQMLNIMKMNPPPSPNSPGYGQYFWDLYNRPDMLCKTEAYENFQDPNVEGMPPYYFKDMEDPLFDENLSAIEYTDQYGMPVEPYKVSEDDDAVVWGPHHAYNVDFYIPTIPVSHFREGKVTQAINAVKRTADAINKVKDKKLNEIGKKLSGVRYNIMKKVWAKNKNAGVKKIKMSNYKKRWIYPDS